MPRSTKQIEKKQPLATKPQIDLETDSEELANRFERKDLIIPRITILQSNSPQVKKSDKEKFVQGAEEGHIFHTVTQNYWDGEKGVLVVPVSYRLAYLEWKDRKKNPTGGGFVRDHGTNPSILDEAEQADDFRHILPNGNVVVPTAEYFVFLLDGRGDFEPVVLSMASSQLKKSRRWNTVMNELKVAVDGGRVVNPPMFYKSYKLTTVPEQNDQGAWMGWKIDPADDVTVLKRGVEIYNAAKEFRRQVNTGNVRAAVPHDDGASDTGTM